MSQAEVTAFVEMAMAGGTPSSLPQELTKKHLLYRFPDQKKKIAALSRDEKLEWYAHQFQINPGGIPVELTTEEFEKFWKWRVSIPMKIMRFAYKVKNWQFKKHKHISEMKEKVKKHSI